MYLVELGSYVRRVRKSRGMTQSALAREAGIARETLNLIESGSLKDLGFAKVSRVLGVLGLDLRVSDTIGKATDAIAVAASAGSTGFKEPLSGEELIWALLTGNPPARKSPHLRRLLEDSSPRLVAGLVNQISNWVEPARVQRGLLSLAAKLDVAARREWSNRD